MAIQQLLIVQFFLEGLSASWFLDMSLLNRRSFLLAGFLAELLLQIHLTCDLNQDKVDHRPVTFFFVGFEVRIYLHLGLNEDSS